MASYYRPKGLSSAVSYIDPKAAYRFLQNDKVTPQQILSSHVKNNFNSVDKEFQGY
jgi:hypothetical protein